MEWRQRVYCGDLTPSDAGKDVLLMGWVDAFRDHGSLLFIHLRDVRGIVQVVFNPEVSKESYDQAGGLKEEYVIKVRGKVALRQRGTENPNLSTGGLEVLAEQIDVLSLSRNLPSPLARTSRPILKR
jgi:aspartyl-tRNA synthetase